ncbi:MAG: VanW family protein [Actinomycetota bacterium]|nr:VanW family protein [Actinomycetota bacterium]
METYKSSRKTVSGGGYPRGSSRGRRKVSIIVLVVCAALAGAVALDYWSNSGRIYNGVSVAGVDVGGKTTGEAEAQVQERLAQNLDEIDLSGPQDFTLGARQLDVSYDVPATMDRAYEIGRGGNVLERLTSRLQAAYGSAEVSPEIEYDPARVDALTQTVAQRVDGQPREASVAVEGAEVLVGESREGFRMNVPATAANIRAAIEGATGETEMVGEAVEPAMDTPAAEAAATEARDVMSGEVLLSTGEEEWTLTPAEVGQTLDFVPKGGDIDVALNRERLRAAASEPIQALTAEPREAGYELNGDEVVVTASQTGMAVDEQAFFADLETGLFEGRREYEIPVDTDEPELVTAEAEALKPTDLLGKYRTDYAVVPDDGMRVENLEIASEAVDGLFVAPGEIFSMNENVAGLDYNATKVIIDGKETLADGGGLCQVTSTLYMAANYAGLDITERSPHYAQLPYIRPGLDATVWFGDENGVGALDMKFENTSDGYVLIRQRVADDGYVYAEVYGKPSNTKVEMTSEPKYMGADYSKWNTYQKVTKDGEVVYDGLLHKDTYNPLIDEKGKTIPPPEVPVPVVRQ